MHDRDKINKTGDSIPPFHTSGNATPGNRDRHGASPVPDGTFKHFFTTPCPIVICGDTANDRPNGPGGYDVLRAASNCREYYTRLQTPALWRR